MSSSDAHSSGRAESSVPPRRDGIAEQSSVSAPEARADLAGDRLGLSALDYAIPPAANRLPYKLGGLTFIGLLVLKGTGLLLDQFFSPDPLSAYDSVVYIMTRVPLGDQVTRASDTDRLDPQRVAPPTTMVTWREPASLVVDNNLAVMVLTRDTASGAGL